MQFAQNGWQETTIRAIGIHNGLNGNVCPKENPAARFKLNHRGWNIVDPTSQLYVYIEAHLPDDRRLGKTSLVAATNGRDRPSAKAAETYAASVGDGTSRSATESVELYWKVRSAAFSPAAHKRDCRWNWRLGPIL